MRSIGAWKIKKLKKIVEEEMDILKFGRDMKIIRDRIEERIPSDWYDTWESAWSEINRLVNDFINDYRRGER